MGAAVAALGSIAGSYAAKAIMGEPKVYKPDTSIPGVDSATIKEGNKSKPAVEVPQVNISQALDWYKQAASEQENFYRQGLGFYANSLMQGAAELQKGYASAENKLTPMSYSANQALNEQMRYMGLDPVPATRGLEAQLTDYSPELSKQLNDANKLQDPTLRAKAKQDILAGINGLKQDIPDINAGKPELYTAKNWKEVNGDQWTTREELKAFNANEQQKVEAAKQKLTDWNNGGITRAQGAFNALNKNQDITDLSNQFSNEYTDTYDKAYTGADISKKIEATPGYNFQFEQGQKGIARQQAARGMLGSGNTLLAAQAYGQDLAQNYFNVNMDRLSQIVAEGSPATMQIASNKIQAGRDYSQLMEAGGQAAMSTYGAIGDARATSLYNQGSAFIDAAKFNASMQFAGIENNKNRESRAQDIAMTNLPAQQANALQQQKFNYSVFQNQQGGQAFAQQASSNPNSVYNSFNAGAYAKAAAMGAAYGIAV